MPLSIMINDIMKIACDAIVNPTNNALHGIGKSLDGKIHHICGQEFERECILLGGCETGKAKVTKAYNLPCKYVIHTVSPIWRGGHFHEDEFLASCYRESLKICQKYRFHSVAFPIIASGSNRYPKENAFRIALNEIKAFLATNDLLIYLVVYDPEAIAISLKLKNEVEKYILAETALPTATNAVQTSAKQQTKVDFYQFIDSPSETFLEKLWRFIDKKGLSNPQCYKRANMDKKHFSKIQANKIKPKKATVLALAIALELTLNETTDLLKSAGYALSHNDKSDLIVEYFITNANYDIFELNCVLFDFGQNPL